MKKGSKYVWAGNGILLGLILLASCLGVADHDLWTPDEPRDAAVSLAMARSGDLVVPMLAGEPFIEKPPLYFVAASLFAKWFGECLGNVGAIRLSSAMWGLGWLGVTFLLGRRLFGSGVGRLGAIILATTLTFMLNAHWIRVDIALAFFVTGALWCLAEMWTGKRSGIFGATAGLFMAGAFLVKGVVGPLLVGTGWLPLAVGTWMDARVTKKSFRLHLGAHVAMVFVAAAGSGIWIWRLLARQDAALWKAWFWDNHVGRTQGTTVELGHLHPHEPFYYLFALLIAILPWTPLLLAVLWQWSRRAWAQRNTGWKKWLADPRVILFGWGILGMIFLSVPATKRDIYQLPLMSAWALVCASGFRQAMDLRWVRYFYQALAWIIWIALVVLAISPVWGHVLTQAPDALLAWDWRHAGTILLALGVGWMRFRCKWTPDQILIYAATLACAIWLVPSGIVDEHKRLGSGYTAFAAQLPQNPETRARVAAWNLTETGRGGLEFYGDVVLPRVTEASRAEAILSGDDLEFDQLVVEREPKPDEWPMPTRLLAQETFGPRLTKRALYWLEPAK